VECLMGDEDTAALAKELGVTRAHAAMNLAAPMLRGGIAMIGNAPTALIRLLELMDQGKAAPALIVGMPVGFVNAAESKELLLPRKDVPYITVQGRKGGTTLAAAAVNALAEIALRGMGGRQ
jgi:precorrin-8X/cobalt-precorrin-8 methylmutase